MAVKQVSRTHIQILSEWFMHTIQTSRGPKDFVNVKKRYPDPPLFTLIHFP